MARLLKTWIPNKPGEMVVGKLAGEVDHYHFLMVGCVDEAGKSLGHVVVPKGITFQDHVMKGGHYALQFQGWRESKSSGRMYALIDSVPVTPEGGGK